MKKINTFLMIILMTIFISCESEKSKETKVYSDFYNEHPENIVVNKFTFEGHDYLNFITKYGTLHDSYSGWVHDPNCKTCKNDTIQ